MFTQNDINLIRKDFPILDEKIHEKPLIYFDNAATTQVPNQVIECIENHYHHNNANVHRGIHSLSERSTHNLEESRKTVASFINANTSTEICFSYGTTSSINMLAAGWKPQNDKCNSIVVTSMEHHSNFVPWQQRCFKENWNFLVSPLDENYELDLNKLEALLSENEVGIVAITHVSNVLGCVNDISSIVKMAHAYGAEVLVDAAQSIRHENVDVQELDCDYLAFSGHKTLGPTGIGVLWGKEALLERLSPCFFGGEMVDKVSSQNTTFEHAPLRFEAGTPNYVGAIALSGALEYINTVGRSEICQYEHELIKYIENKLKNLNRVKILGSPKKRAGCLSFEVENAHPFDIAVLLDKLGVAVRSGNQCAQPLLHESVGRKNITRVSPAFYNTYDEVDLFIEALDKVITIL